MKERKALLQHELHFSGTTSSNSLGLYVLENLLLLSGRESDPIVRQIIAKCLGNLMLIHNHKFILTQIIIIIIIITIIR